MSRRMSIRLLTLATLLGSLICFTSCGGQTKYSLPPMGEAAVLNLPLADRPILDLTDAEITAIYKASPTGTGKILKNQAGWIGYADVADAAVEGYRNYLRDIFSAKKK